MNLLFDAHLDLSMNALEWNRDLTQPIEAIRKLETGMTDLRGRGQNTVNFETMREGGIGLCVATQIGGCMKPPGPVASWESPAQAWAMTQGQAAYYQAMVDAGELTPVRNLVELESQLAQWSTPEEAATSKAPIGYVMSLEGADSIVDLDYLDQAWETGLRAMGPAHYGMGRYALGHDKEGGLPSRGKDLIRKMEELGLILDVTHLSEQCFFEAVELFGGSIWASHSNARSLVDNPRQFSDEQLLLLIERNAVIGSVFDAWMMVPGWVRDSSESVEVMVTLERIVDHMDHICQLAGNAHHVGIGSDLDGGFGKEQSPSDLDTIADLQRLDPMLRQRGYAEDDIQRIFHSNFLSVLQRAWS
ncbi:MAG: membrane dipeptidase [Verrucomicrobiota bacterium]